MPPTFDHAALHVRDLETSAEFYVRVVGLERTPDPFQDERHLWLRIGTHAQLHLIAGTPAKVADDIDVHLAFRVPSVAAFTAHLEQAHVVYRGGPHLGEQVIGVRADGVSQVYFQDPDGYWIEMNDAKYGSE